MATTMSSTASADAFEVVTPVLRKATSVQNDLPASEVSLLADLVKNEYEEGSIDEHFVEKATDKETKKAIALEEHAEDKTGEEFSGDVQDSLAGDHAIEFNGARYVEASGLGELDFIHCITVNGISYIPEYMHGQYKKTAHSLLHYHEYAENQEASTTHISNSQFRGQPIMVYVGPGSQSYSVHTFILTKSPVLGQMPLEQAEDGTYTLRIPDEDPTQFETLLAYLYRGTWEPDMSINCEICWSTPETRRCVCWNNMKYMQLYATACKYGVHRLTEMIAVKLDLKEGVLAFCEAFKRVYEKCPGNAEARGLFRKNLPVVFENEVRQGGLWGGNEAAAGQVAEMASSGGEYAVDLTTAFATAQANSVLSKMDDERDYEEPTGWDKWGNSWDDENNIDANAIQSGDHEGHGKKAAWVTKVQVTIPGSTGDWGRDRPLAPAPAPSVIRDILTDKVRGLENMMASLQLNAEKSAEIQQAGFSKTPYGDAPGYMPAGYLPFLPPSSAWGSQRDGPVGY